MPYPSSTKRTSLNAPATCREFNMTNDLAPELSRRKRVVWRPLKSVEETVKKRKKKKKKKKNVRFRAHLFDSTVLPAMTYALQGKVPNSR
ncbi:unnamed protein product [Heligmosomoides polygyrus]|uniref:Uncharacterized protein n=1 Tax=Heligmosomoides polygyrus TaxID=6339 RepID=A0A183GRI0_HELPZ|nr:unnamed protein product [Heligmosomoides polygyrus]